MSTKTSAPKFVLSSAEATNLLNIPKQKLYSMRDISTVAKNPRRPILKKEEDWAFQDGKVMFTRESIEKLLQWKSQSTERKAVIQRDKKVDIEAMVIINGVAETVKGKAGLRIQKIIEKSKAVPVAKPKKESYLEEPKADA